MRGELGSGGFAEAPRRGSGVGGVLGGELTDGECEEDEAEDCAQVA